MSAPPDQAARQDPDPRKLGILLVHGVGSQKRGETIPADGEALYQWFRAFLARSMTPAAREHSPVCLGETHLTQPDPGDPEAPPFSRLCFTPQPGAPAGEAREWILAEGWWAETFGPPRFSDLVPWGLGIGPWMFERLVGLPILRLEDVLEQAWGVQKAAGFLTGLILTPLLFLAGILLQMAIVALLVVGAVPQFRGFVESVQQMLAGWIGDAYVIVSSPVRMKAMVTEIRRNIDWLVEQQHCGRVAVIASSGGAPLAYEALSEPAGVQRRVPFVLVTYASAKPKFDLMSAALPNQAVLFAVSPAVRMIGILGLVWGAVRLCLAPFPDLVGAGLVLVSFLLFLGLHLWGWGFEKTQVRHNSKMPAPRLPDNVTWRDYCAVADLVAEPSNDEPHSVMVSNLHSILVDHDTYWQNAEEFLPALAWLLCTVDGQRAPNAPPGWPDDAEIRPVFYAACRSRQQRVLAYLNAGLISLLAAPTLVVGLWDRLHVLGGPIRVLIGSIFTSPLAGASRADDFWALIFGAAIVVGAVAFWQQLLLFPVWRWWSRQETEALYQRVNLAAPAPAEQPIVAAINHRMHTFLALFLLLPVLLLGLPLFRTGFLFPGDLLARVLLFDDAGLDATVGLVLLTFLLSLIMAVAGWMRLYLPRPRPDARAGQATPTPSST